MHSTKRHKIVAVAENAGLNSLVDFVYICQLRARPDLKGRSHPCGECALTILATGP